MLILSRLHGAARITEKTSSQLFRNYRRSDSRSFAALAAVRKDQCCSSVVLEKFRKIHHEAGLSSSRGQIRQLSRAPSLRTELTKPAGYQPDPDHEHSKSKIAPTRTNLLSLTLHLPDRPPLRTLIHPEHPLSFLTLLVSNSLEEPVPKRGITVESPPGIEWARHTTLIDFMRESISGFDIVIRPDANKRSAPSDNDGSKPVTSELRIHISVPPFAERTKFLRERLDRVVSELQALEGVKKECDILAYRGARRIAAAGLGSLVTWWGVVFYYSFMREPGWDSVEPATYLVGLTGIIAGYTWFLQNRREVSYGSVLNTTITQKQEKLYNERGFDIERWRELVEEGRHLRRQLQVIAEEYQVKWEGRGTEVLKEAEESEREKRPENGPSGNKE